jgi:hypothetical protein
MEANAVGPHGPGAPDAPSHALDARALGPFQEHFPNSVPLASLQGRLRQRPSVLPATNKTCTRTVPRARRPGEGWRLWRSRLPHVSHSHYRCYDPPLCVILCEKVKNL